MGDEEGQDTARSHPPPAPPHPVPHHYQETDHTCGAAALRMVLEAVAGAPREEADLARILATDDVIGTRQVRLLDYLRQHGFDVAESHTDSTLDDIARSLDEGRVVLVLYHLESEGIDHYAVVSRLGPLRIFLHDPWLGPETAMPVEEFVRAWRSRDDVPGRRDRWMLSVAVAPRPPPAGLGPG